MHLKHHIVPKWKKMAKEKKIGARQKGIEARLKGIALITKLGTVIHYKPLRKIGIDKSMSITD